MSASRSRWNRIVVPVFLALAGFQIVHAQNEPPEIRRELRAAWVATVYNLDWPTSRTLTPTAQRNEIVAILNQIQATNMNAVFVQVRPQADAFYQNPSEPWSEFLTNVMGTAPNPFYDPLQYWIDQAKVRGIEVHAWINPYRAKAGTATVSSSLHVTNSHPHMVRTYGSNKWIDPGHPEAPGYTLAAVNRLVSAYDLDGIVIDDYFYPYPITGQAFPDTTTYAAYQSGGGTLSLANWRRQNVDSLVQTLYATIKSTKPWVKFGIAPFGIWRPNNPPGVTGLDAYASLYADSKKWLNNGWLDIVSPQLYWRIDSSGQPYGPLLNWWASQNTQGRVVAPSHNIYEIGSAGSNWPVSEIINQVEITRATPGGQGAVFYRTEVIMDNRDGLRTTLQNGIYSSEALIPRYTWLDSVPPPQPNVRMTDNGATVTVNLTQRPGEVAKWWAVYTRNGDTWTTDVLPASTTSFNRTVITTNGRLHTIFISAVDRNGNESEKSLIGLLGPKDGG